MALQEDENLETIYSAVGGTPWFVDLIESFYAKVDADTVLRSMYPDDLTESKDHMVKFLIQVWGGPTTYSEQRGHPRLRMRHMPFVIGVEERDAWFEHMAEAISEAEPPDEIQQTLLEYFSNAATHMINQAH